MEYSFIRNFVIHEVKCVCRSYKLTSVNLIFFYICCTSIISMWPILWTNMLHSSVLPVFRYIAFNFTHNLYACILTILRVYLFLVSTYFCPYSHITIIFIYWIFPISISRFYFATYNTTLDNEKKKLFFCDTRRRKRSYAFDSNVHHRRQLMNAIKWNENWKCVFCSEICYGLFNLFLPWKRDFTPFHWLAEGQVVSKIIHV